jgi:hypothetical protein
MVGYAWNVNFASAIANGLVGNIELDSDKTPAQFAYDIIKTGEHDDQNTFDNWLYEQEQQGRIELLELRSEHTSHSGAFGHFRDYQIGIGKDGDNRIFVPYAENISF